MSIDADSPLPHPLTRVFAINGIGCNDLSGGNFDVDGDIDATLIGENIWVPETGL